MQGRIVGAVEGSDYVWRQFGEVIARKPLSDVVGSQRFEKALKRNKRWERPDGTVGDE